MIALPVGYAEESGDPDAVEIKVFYIQYVGSGRHDRGDDVPHLNIWALLWAVPEGCVGGKCGYRPDRTQGWPASVLE